MDKLFGRAGMIEIVENLYLGNRAHAQDHGVLVATGITHIVNCAGELPNYHEGRFVYHSMGMSDPDPDVLERIGPACAFIDEGRASGKVLVHCFAAVSRSPSTILAYLLHQGDTLEDAARRLAALVWTCPDRTFLEQLGRFRALEQQIHDFEKLGDILCGRR
jgi:atypical dual specificity phosphatase